MIQMQENQVSSSETSQLTGNGIYVKDFRFLERKRHYFKWEGSNQTLE